MTSHLNSEQMERVLAGNPAHEVSLHLSKCGRCADDVASMREALGNFRSAATRAAEHHRHFAAPVIAAGVSRMAWVLASVVLFAGIAAPFVVRRETARPVPGNVAAQPAETISDEALLNNVQNDLSASVPESLLPLAGTSTSASNSTNAKRKN